MPHRPEPGLYAVAILKHREDSSTILSERSSVAVGTMSSIIARLGITTAYVAVRLSIVAQP